MSMVKGSGMMVVTVVTVTITVNTTVHATFCKHTQYVSSNRHAHCLTHEY